MQPRSPINTVYPADISSGSSTADRDIAWAAITMPSLWPWDGDQGVQERERRPGCSNLALPSLDVDPRRGDQPQPDQTEGQAEEIDPKAAAQEHASEPEGVGNSLSQSCRLPVVFADEPTDNRCTFDLVQRDRPGAEGVPLRRVEVDPTVRPMRVVPA